MNLPINYVDSSALIGAGAKVWWYAVILQNVRIGVNCSIGSHTEIGRGSRIGDQTRIGANCFLPPNSDIGCSVFIGPGVTFTDDKFPYVHTPEDPDYNAQPPIVEDFASIGAGAVILPGVRIGKYAKIAAGAVVTRDVQDYAMAKGIPAFAVLAPDGWTQQQKEGLLEA